MLTCIGSNSCSKRSQLQTSRPPRFSTFLQSPKSGPVVLPTFAEYHSFIFVSTFLSSLHNLQKVIPMHNRSVASLLPEKKPSAPSSREDVPPTSNCRRNPSAMQTMLAAHRNAISSDHRSRLRHPPLAPIDVNEDSVWHRAAAMGLVDSPARNPWHHVASPPCRTRASRPRRAE